MFKVAVAHRTGVVEVMQPSVIIVVSSAHRRASLEVGAAGGPRASLQARACIDTSSYPHPPHPVVSSGCGVGNR